MSTKFIQEKIYHVLFKKDIERSDECMSFIANDVIEAAQLCKEYYSSYKNLEVLEVRRGSMAYRKSTKTITVDV